MSDLDELVRTRRFDEIHEARRQVIEDERALNEALATGAIDDSRAKKLFQRSINAYVRELEYLLNPPTAPDADGSDPDRWWHNETVGLMELPNDNVLTVEGLGEFLALDEEIQVRVKRITRDRYCEVGTPEVQTVHIQPTWEILHSAFRTANAAATDLGMELDISDEQRTEITEELINQTEQWRRNNL